MKALEDLTQEELLEYAKKATADSEAKDAQLKEAHLVVTQLKEQATEKKAVPGSKTRVQIDGETYEFPTETFTLPDTEHGGNIKTVEAKKITKGSPLLAQLRDSGFLVKVEKK